MVTPRCVQGGFARRTEFTLFDIKRLGIFIQFDGLGRYLRFYFPPRHFIRFPNVSSHDRFSETVSP